MLKRELKSWLLLLILFTIVVLPNIVYVFYAYDNSPIKPLIGLIVGAYIVLFVPFLFFSNYYKIYLLFLIIVNILLLPVELVFLQLYHEQMDLIALTVALETNIEEALGFVSGYEFFLIFGILIHIFIVSYLFKNIKIKKISFLRVVGFISLILVLIFAYRSSKIIGQDFSCTLYKNVLTNKSPWLLFRLSFDYLHNKQELKRLEKIHNKFKFNAHKQDNVPQTHILIIAESSRYDHWGLHGYKRETTPYLSKEKNIVSMSNVTTGAGATNWATPLMLTPTTALNFDESHKKHSIIGAFREAGYETHWISNQDRFPYLVLHANEAEHKTYIKDKKIDAYDEVLLPKLKNIINANKKNKLIVLHIMGNHWKYDKRYPKKYDYFQPSIYGQNIRMDDYEYIDEIINSYDNSMLYTDFIFEKIIKIASRSKNPITVTYISDHGENLYDTKEKLFGHGRRVNKPVIEIPWVFWYSDSYKEKYPDKINNVIANKDKKISSDNNLFFSILDVGQITYNDFNHSRTLFGNKFKEEKRFTLRGLDPIDYDNFIKRKGKKNANK